MDAILQSACAAIIRLVEAFDLHPTGACMLLLILLAIAAIGFAWRRSPPHDEKNSARMATCQHDETFIMSRSKVRTADPAALPEAGGTS